MVRSHDTRVSHIYLFKNIRLLPKHKLLVLLNYIAKVMSKFKVQM